MFKTRSGVRALLHMLNVSVLVFLISGCATLPLLCLKDPNSVECLCATGPESIECACARDPDSAECLCGGDASSADCACAKDPDSLACLCAKDLGAGGRQPCPGDSAASLTAEALQKIDGGNWRLGSRLIDFALESSSTYGRARSVREQLDTEPASYFRSKFGSQSVTYVVRVSDSLSKIAEACLGDRDYFVSLARLNDIELPRELAYGQRIKVPGSRCEPMPQTGPELEAPPEVTVDPASSPDISSGETDHLAMALEAEQAGDLPRAYEFAAAALESDPQNTDLGTAYRRIKADYIDSLASTAYEQDDRGDFEDAMVTWQRVLEIDKYNAEALMMLRVLREELKKKK